jgi:hypothetical protein
MFSSRRGQKIQPAYYRPNTVANKFPLNPSGFQFISLIKVMKRNDVNLTCFFIYITYIDAPTKSYSLYL